MVDYQGPAILESLCDRFEVPIFNHIIGVTFRIKDTSNPLIVAKELASLKRLKSVSMERYSRPISETDQWAQSPDKLLKPCQVASVTETENKIDIAVSSLSCCAK